MKKVLLILFFTLLSVSAKADYDGYHISFTIENTDGKKLKGYGYVAAAYLELDSLQNTHYLKNALNQNRQDEWANRKSFTYFQSRIVYNYTSILDQQKNYEYYLTEEKALSYKSIKKIVIDDMINWSYLSGMIVLNTSDLAWLKSKPLKSYALSCFLCEYQIFAHESNRKIDTIIGRVEPLMKELDRIEQSKLELEAHGHNTNDTEVQLDEMNEKIDNETIKILEQLKGYKVVVVSYCTC